MSDYKKKLIEVALPLEAINRASAREKSIRHGHPSTLHLWWARRPLATCRAVLFASLVDDPSAHPDEFPTEEAQEVERQRLFRIIEELVKWESSTNETVLNAARAEIMRSTGGNPPPVLDPFCGGGSIPLEAQRLGLEAHGSDLNPVAVLITKALIEIPPKFAGLPPVNPEAQAKLGNTGWRGAQGLADDVRYYGRWMRDQAEQRIGCLYPKIEVTPEVVDVRPDLKQYVGTSLTVVAWLWARTVRSPNPAFATVRVPLTSTFMLSSKAGKESYVEPVVENGGYRFTVKFGKPKDPLTLKNGTRAGTAQDFLCLMSGAPVPRSYIRDEGKAGRLGVRLMAIVAQGDHGRLYLPPSEESDPVALRAAETALVADARATFLSGLTPTRAMITGGVCSAYGLSTWGSLFTDRQLVALTTFSDLVSEARERVSQDIEATIVSGVWPCAVAGDRGATAVGYADAVATYLAFALSKMADRGSTICTWFTERDSTRNTFARQAIPMTWDFAELNTLLGGTGSFEGAVHWTAESLDGVAAGPLAGDVKQLDATAAMDVSRPPMISTDPPYYNNIGYAELSDFFYVWLRRALRGVYPDLFSTLLTPKSQELVATPHRFDGNKRKAQAFFETGLGASFAQMRKSGNPDYPLTVYYAFKQAESKAGDSAGSTASTGWETMLSGLLQAGFAVTGTWPMRSELSNRMVGQGTNALASSVVLVCRPRAVSAPLATRKEYIGALRAELPDALKKLQHGNIAPVDLAQASIGPGMAVFSRYAKVMEADGSQMSVRSALALINQMLDEILAEQEGEFDADTRWAIAWFEQFGIRTGEFGDAETLSRAKGTSVEGMVQAGFLEAKGGKVRLLPRDELDEDWDPATDKRLTVWEMTQHLLRRLDEGEAAAAALARQLGSFAEVARDLAYRLYLVCERKKWSQEGQAYNGLVVAWPQIQQLAATVAPSAGTTQEGLF